MSDSQDAKAAKRQREAALAYTPGDDGLWDWEALSNAVNYGNGVPVGAKFKAPATMQDLLSIGVGNGASPDGGSTGLDKFLSDHNLTLPQYQRIYGGLPLTFNGDGTATYDPSAQKNLFSYIPEKTFMDYAGPIMMAVLGGAGLAGLGAGTAAGSEFALAPAGTGIGGVGTAGLGLNTSGIGLTPGLIQAGGGLSGMGLSSGLGLSSAGSLAGLLGGGEGLAGSFGMDIPMSGFTSALDLGGGALDLPANFNFADTFNQLPSLEGGAVTPTNLNLSAGGFNSINDIINAISTGGELTTGSVGAGGAIGAALGTAPLASGSAGILDTIKSLLSSPGANAASTASGLIKQLTGADVSPGMLDLIGKLGSTALGVYGSNQQADATKDLYNRFFDLGAPYRASLASLEADPNSFYNSDIVKGAIQQSSDAMANSLSMRGNPANNPGALQEIQKNTTRGLLDAYNNRFSQLASAGQLGVGQSAALGTNAVSSQGGLTNALGAGLQSVLGNQRDYAGDFLDILRNRSSLGGASLV